MTHVTNVHVTVEMYSACSRMRKKRTLKKNTTDYLNYKYLNKQRDTNDFLCISESHLGSSCICPLGLRSWLQDLTGGRRECYSYGADNKYNEYVHCYTYKKRLSSDTASSMSLVVQK